MNTMTLYTGTDESASPKLEAVKKELWRCRNELCLYCGRYKNKHLGSCDGCHWEDLSDVMDIKEGE